MVGLHFSVLRPNHLLNIYLFQRLFSFPQESRSTGQLFFFGTAALWEVWMAPSPFAIIKLEVSWQKSEMEPKRTCDFLRRGRAKAATWTFWLQTLFFPIEGPCSLWSTLLLEERVSLRCRSLGLRMWMHIYGCNLRSSLRLTAHWWPPTFP